jgi:hypothetical protein
MRRKAERWVDGNAGGWVARTGGSVGRPLGFAFVNVPGFIARQFYVQGSLRNADGGWELQAHNPISDGLLVGVGSMSVDGKPIAPDAVSARRPDGEVIRATNISRTNPVKVAKGDRVTLHVAGSPLAPGEHKLEVALYEINLGLLSFTISDRVG